MGDLWLPVLATSHDLTRPHFRRWRRSWRREGRCLGTCLVQRPDICGLPKTERCCLTCEVCVRCARFLCSFREPIFFSVPYFWDFCDFGIFSCYPSTAVTSSHPPPSLQRCCPAPVHQTGCRGRPAPGREVSEASCGAVVWWAVLFGPPQSRGICISHRAHTWEDDMDDIHKIQGWNLWKWSLETNGLGTGTVQRSLTWSDLMQSNWKWALCLQLLTSQNMTCIEAVWTVSSLASFAGNVHNQHNLAIVLVQGHVLSVDVLHREVVDAITCHFLRKPRPWWLSKSATGAVYICLCCITAALLCIYASFSHTCRNPLTRRYHRYLESFEIFTISPFFSKFNGVARFAVPELVLEGALPPPAPKRFRPVCDCLKVWQHVTSNSQKSDNIYIYK